MHFSLQRDIRMIVYDSEKDDKFDVIRWVSRFRAWLRVDKEAHRLLKDAKVSHPNYYIVSAELIRTSSYQP